MDTAMHAKRLVQSLLKRYGYRIARVAPSYSEEQYTDAIRQIYSLYGLCVFPDLPEASEERLRLLRQLIGTSTGEAIYILNYLAASLPLPGDICEFGVAQGTTSALMGHEIMNTQKNIWLFDSFEGLPMPSEKKMS